MSDGNFQDPLKEDRQIKREQEVIKAARAFLNKIKEVEKHPDYKSVFHLAANHGCMYNGPTYEEEFVNLEKSLENL